jgi:hypothetical protein
MRGGRLYNSRLPCFSERPDFRMKLIAVKKISARLAEGAMFEAQGARARMLIALGLAKAVEEVERPMRRTYRRRDMQAEA